MNILYISDVDPRKTAVGRDQRGNYLWKSLCEISNVYSIQISWDDSRYIGDNIYRIHFIYPEKISSFKVFIQKIQFALNVRLGCLNLGPYRMSLEKDIIEVFKDIKFDAIVCRYINTVSSYKLWRYNIPIFVDIDDHPLQVQRTLYLSGKNKVFKFLFEQYTKFQLRLVEYKIFGGWIANESQAHSIRSKTPIQALHNLPIGPSRNYDYLKEERQNYLFTIGYMGYKPNYGGVETFIKEIWPSIHNRFPGLKYYIGGMDAPQDYVDRWNSFEGVEYLGFVENLEKLYENSLASVVPVYSGGGTCIKTLESFAHSRVCISSPFGARGLEKYFDSKDIGLFIYNDTNTFIKILEQEVFDKSKRQINETNAKNFLDKNYSYENFKESVKNVLDTIKG